MRTNYVLETGFLTIVLADLQSEALALPDVVFESLLGQIRSRALHF